MYDIKTTSRYEFGKYSDGWQRHVYPYCLISSGLVKDIDSFEYTAYHLKGGTSRTPLITGVQYPELYKYLTGSHTGISQRNIGLRPLALRLGEIFHLSPFFKISSVLIVFHP